MVYIQRSIISFKIDLPHTPVSSWYLTIFFMFIFIMIRFTVVYTVAINAV